MLHYLIQIVSYQLLFLVIYDVFHKKDTFFHWNRFYLIITPLLSLVLPFIKIKELGKVSSDIYTTNIERIISFVGDTEKDVLATATSPEVSGVSINWWLAIYFIGMITSFILFALKIYQLRILKSIPLTSFQTKTNIIKLSNSKQAFSFWNTIFLGDALSEEEKQQILRHELVHVQQKHSLDQLLFEVLKIIFWWNPTVYFFQERITVLHEYIADDITISEVGKIKYLEQLLNTTFQTQKITFVNQFFHQSLIKKRIVMLQKSKSRNFAKFKYLLLLPIILCILSYTSCNAEASKDNPVNDTVTISPRENEPICLNNNSKYDTALNNYLKIVNGDSSEVLVHLVSLDQNSANVRVIHLRNGVTHFIRNIPEGNYRADIVYGTDYTEKNVNGKCTGSFDKIIATESGRDILDFNTVRTEQGLNMPSYSITLNLLDDSTEKITKNEKRKSSTSKSTCLSSHDKFDKSIDNYLKFTNDSDSEIIVFLITKATDEIVRSVYLKKETTQKLKNIPEDKYAVNVIYGEGYVEKNSNGKCTPTFKNIVHEEEGRDVLDFNVITTKNGINIPNYSMKLSPQE